MALSRQLAEGPQFTLPVLWRRAVISTPVVPAGAFNDVFSAGAVFAVTPRRSTTTFTSVNPDPAEMSSRSCNVRLMLRPARSACPALVRTFTSELSQVGSPRKPVSDITSWLIVCYHGRIFPGRTDSLMGCDGVWTFCRLKRRQSRRNCITQPRVARHELPWVCAPK